MASILVFLPFLSFYLTFSVRCGANVIFTSKRVGSFDCDGVASRLRTFYSCDCIRTYPNAKIEWGFFLDNDSYVEISGDYEPPGEMSTKKIPYPGSASNVLDLTSWIGASGRSACIDDPSHGIVDGVCTVCGSRV